LTPPKKVKGTIGGTPLTSSGLEEVGILDNKRMGLGGDDQRLLSTAGV